MANIRLHCKFSSNASVHLNLIHTLHHNIASAPNAINGHPVFNKLGAAASDVSDAPVASAVVGIIVMVPVLDIVACEAPPVVAVDDTACEPSAAADAVAAAQNSAAAGRTSSVRI